MVAPPFTLQGPTLTGPRMENFSWLLATYRKHESILAPEELMFFNIASIPSSEPPQTIGSTISMIKIPCCRGSPSVPTPPAGTTIRSPHLPAKQWPI
ncbi:hypothetical protein D3C87_1264710 [compost metagenome]